MFDESKQIIVTNNGVTMLKPHWMSQDYWQKYEVPRCGKTYGNKGVLYGQALTGGNLTRLKDRAREAEANADDDCVGCKV